MYAADSRTVHLPQSGELPGTRFLIVTQVNNGKGFESSFIAFVQLSTCQFLTSSLLLVEKAINGLDSSEICLRAQSDSLGKR